MLSVIATSATESNGRPTTSQRVSEQQTQIREAAKWLIAAFAGVGAALIAGSQLSSIGRLPVCDSTTLVCARLWIAVAGAVLALGGVGWAIWVGVGLLTPTRLHLGELKVHWKLGDPIYDFFQRNKSYLQGFSDFSALETEEQAAYDKFDDLNDRIAAESGDTTELERELENAETELQDILDRGDDVVTMANHAHYVHNFRHKALRHLVGGAALAAGGILAFAWAANPPVAPDGSSLRGADLSEADLSGVDLRWADMTGASLKGADLTGADLRDAVLQGADLDDVVWSNTLCPDGTNSDDAAGSCENHI